MIVEVVVPFRQTSVRAEFRWITKRTVQDFWSGLLYPYERNHIFLIFTIKKCVRWSNWFSSASSSLRGLDSFFWWVGIKGEAAFTASSLGFSQRAPRRATSRPVLPGNARRIRCRASEQPTQFQAGAIHSALHAGEGKTPMWPLRVGHCLSPSRPCFDSARLPKDKASFLFGSPARRSKGAGVDARRDRAGVGEKGSHAGRHRAPPEVSPLCGARSVTIVLGSPNYREWWVSRWPAEGDAPRLQDGPSSQLAWLSSRGSPPQASNISEGHHGAGHRPVGSLVVPLQHLTSCLPSLYSSRSWSLVSLFPARAQCISDLCA